MPFSWVTRLYKSHHLNSQNLILLGNNNKNSREGETFSEENANERPPFRIYCDLDYRLTTPVLFILLRVKSTAFSMRNNGRRTMPFRLFFFGCLISRQAWSRCRVSSYVVEKSTCPFSFILKIVWNFKMRKQKGRWKKETNEREGKTKQQQKEKGKRMKETRETKEKNI